MFFHVQEGCYTAGAICVGFKCGSSFLIIYLESKI